MKSSRPSRCLAALITLFSLLFAQLALAAYVCPDPVRAPLSAGVSVDHSTMAGCTEIDEQQQGLCKAHCDGSRQSLDAPATPLVAPFVAAALILVIPDASLAPPFPANHTSTAWLRQPTAPPIAIRNCCFRI